MNVATVVESLGTIAPLALAESWDRVGLLIGSTTWKASRLLLTIDLTGPVLDEAMAVRTDMIVAYHPPIFEPLPALTDATEKQRLALAAAGARIAVYSPHTALDAAPGGVNDWLAHAAGPGATTALAPAAELPPSEACKIVTFSPARDVDRIRDAMSAAGAGTIGAYTWCSFELSGTGTFLGGAGTSPAVGRRGTPTRVDEIRLEMVCGKAALGPAVDALRASHPYEEPPIEIYDLAARPRPGVGAGRRVELERPLALADVVDRFKRHLGVGRLRVAPAYGARRRYGTIGVCAGAGGALLDAAIGAGCELFVTGEMRHHDVLDAQSRGCTIVLAGHTNTERGYLKRLRTRMARDLPKATITIARRDRDPLREM